MSAYTDLLAASDELVNARYEWVGDSGQRHRVRIPGLLEQLYTAAVDPTMAPEEGGTRMKPRSKPPVALEALSRYQDITTAVARWMHSLKLIPRNGGGLESNIIALVSSTTRKVPNSDDVIIYWDEDTLEALLSEVRQWRRWAAVLTGWESRPWQPRLRCPICEGRSTIWVNDAQRSAYCSACLFTWDDVQDLAEKVASRVVAA